LNLMELDNNIYNALSHLEDVIDECLNCENLEERKEVTSASQVGMDSLLMPPLEFAASHVSVRPCSPGLGLKDTVEEYLAPTHSHTDKEGLEEAADELDLTGIDDEEIDSYIMTEKEVEWKTAMWLEENKEYLKEQEVKARKEEKKKRKKFEKKFIRTKRKKSTKEDAIFVKMKQRQKPLRNLILERKYQPKLITMRSTT